jgi:hypothetical protein
MLLLVASACLIPPLVTIAFLYLHQPRDGTRGRLYQVQNGMSRAEVEAIMGRPPNRMGEAAMPRGWTGPPDTVLFWDEWNYRAEVALRNDRVRLRDVFYLNHQPTLVDRWAPSWMYDTSPPAWLDGWWPQ